MKAFFEEYGFVVLAVVVVIILLGLATPIGDAVKTALTGFVTSFTNSVTFPSVS